MKLSVSVALVAAVASAGELSMSPLYSDNAVLQRNMAFPVCGMGRPGASVTVRFAGQVVLATVGADGRWCTKVGPFAASVEGCELAVESNGERCVATNILVGEVFLCSGQSEGVGACPQMR